MFMPVTCRLSILTAAAYTTNAGAIDPLTATVTPSQYITRVEFYLGQTLIGTVTNGINGVYTLKLDGSL